MSNKLRNITVILYRLQRDFGVPIVLRTYATGAKDYATGTVTRTHTDVAIKRAVIGSQKLLSAFSYDLTYLASNKNFTYGAIFNTNTRVCITSYKGAISKQNTKVIEDNKEFEISDFTPILKNKGYIMLLKAVGNVQDADGVDP
mgnify:FL=1|tara:strand:- start:11059 stop:11490 length:432 start_codon:yes stop_codon:yes gene_type:complete